MSFLVTEIQDGRILEVSVSGKLTKEAYEQFVPLTEAAITKFGKVRILLITLGFHGWNAGALWEDFKFELKHFNDIERLAIVGESKWEQGMAVFCRPFTTASIKYFDHSSLEKAREWIREQFAEQLGQTDTGDIQSAHTLTLDASLHHDESWGSSRLKKWGQTPPRHGIYVERCDSNSQSRFFDLPSVKSLLN